MHTKNRKKEETEKYCNIMSIFDQSVNDNLFYKILTFPERVVNSLAHIITVYHISSCFKYLKNVTLYTLSINNANYSNNNFVII